jgi:hypothetical protein
VTLIALKSVGVAANQAPLFDNFRLQPFEHLVLDELGLRLSLKADHAHSSTGVARIIYASDDLRQHGVGLRLIQRVLRAAGPVSVGYMAKNYWL